MEVALRQTQFGIGDVIDDFWDDWWAPTGSGETGYEGGGLPTGTIDYSSGEGDLWIAQANCAEFGVCAGVPLPNIIPYNTPGGQMTGPVPPLTSAQLARAITAGTVVLKSSLTGAAGSAAAGCPSIYATRQGGCVPLAGAGAGQWIPGLPNKTVLLIGGAFLLLAMVGGRK